MKILFSLIGTFIFFQIASSQLPPSIRVKNYIWKSEDPDFKTTKCDEKWKNESAVILCRKYEYQVKKEVLHNILYENIYSHSRILLLDKAAVEEYSTFSFDISRKTGYYFGWRDAQIFLGLKVIKPNGTEEEVPIKNQLIDQIKNDYSNTQIQKVAIPNLEVGDILDYYISFETTLIGSYKFYSFSPVLYPLVEDYPIQKQKIEMHIMRKCYLSAKSMNGAPELQLQDNSKRSDVVWSLLDTDREKSKNQMLTYSLRELPVLAFQAYFTGNMLYNNLYFFVDKEDKLKSAVTDSDFSKFYKRAFGKGSFRSARKIKQFWKKYYSNETNTYVLAREAYNFYREYCYSGSYLYNYYNYKVSDYDFVDALIQAFSSRGIKSSVIITVPREIGDIEDLVMRCQMGFLLKIHTSPPLILSNFSRYSLFSEIDPSYQGNNGKIAEIIDDYDYSPTVSNISVPESECSKNVLSKTMNVSFNLNEADKLKVEEQINATGLQKSFYQYAYITFGDRYKVYQENRYHLPFRELTKSKYTDRIVQLKEKGYTERDEKMTNELNNEYNSKNIKSLKIELVQPGMWDDKPEFIMKNEFELDQFISRVGNNIILEIGKLTGKHMEPEKCDSMRMYNIYFPYAMTFEYAIHIPIPDGYNLKGIENLKRNVVNEAGGFISTPTLEGNKLVVNVKKFYAKNYFPKEKWPLVLQFLNAALDFQEQKVMFVPVQ